MKRKDDYPRWVRSKYYHEQQESAGVDIEKVYETVAACKAHAENAEEQLRGKYPNCYIGRTAGKFNEKCFDCDEPAKWHIWAYELGA